MDLSDKYTALKKYLLRSKRVAVAYSGGVDSTFLLKVAHDALGKDAIAITVISPFFPRHEVRNIRSFTKSLGICHVVMKAKLPDSCWDNTRYRCYECKKHVFLTIRRYAKERGISCVVDASHKDDLGDYRPGRKALKELGIKSPLLESGLCKMEIRNLSRRSGLGTADKESSCCLATRFPYDEKITPAKLERVDAAERKLRRLRLLNLRVRSHEDTARIEINELDIDKVVRNRRQIVDMLRNSGFKYVALDLQGYRQGAMNEVLSWKKRR